jgi:phage gp29-like protein
MPLLVAGVCVVSERSSDKQLDALFSSGVVFTHYDSLVSTTAALVHNDTARTLCQQRAKQLGTTLQQDVQPLIDMLTVTATRAIELNKIGP